MTSASRSRDDRAGEEPARVVRRLSLILLLLLSGTEAFLWVARRWPYLLFPVEESTGDPGVLAGIAGENLGGFVLWLHLDWIAVAVVCLLRFLPRTESPRRKLVRVVVVAVALVVRFVERVEPRADGSWLILGGFEHPEPVMGPLVVRLGGEELSPVSVVRGGGLDAVEQIITAGAGVGIEGFVLGHGAFDLERDRFLPYGLDEGRLTTEVTRQALEVFDRVAAMHQLATGTLVMAGRRLDGTWGVYGFPRGKGGAVEGSHATDLLGQSFRNPPEIHALGNGGAALVGRHAESSHIWILSAVGVVESELTLPVRASRALVRPLLDGRWWSSRWVPRPVGSGQGGGGRRQNFWQDPRVRMSIWNPDGTGERVVFERSAQRGEVVAMEPARDGGFATIETRGDRGSSSDSWSSPSHDLLRYEADGELRWRSSLPGAVYEVSAIREMPDGGWWVMAKADREGLLLRFDSSGRTIDPAGGGRVLPPIRSVLRRQEEEVLLGLDRRTNPASAEALFVGDGKPPRVSESIYWRGMPVPHPEVWSSTAAEPLRVQVPGARPSAPRHFRHFRTLEDGSRVAIADNRAPDHRGPDRRRDLLVRHSKEGEPDARFEARTTRILDRFQIGKIAAVEVVSGDRIVVAGWRNGARSVLLRFLPSGRLDRTYRPPNGALRQVRDLFLAQSGGLVVFGRFEIEGSTFAVLTLDGEGKALNAHLGIGHRVFVAGGGRMGS